MAPTEERPLTEVALCMYNLRGTWALNLATRLAGCGGAYHVGVEVYRLEWSYGWTSRGTGVYVGQVGQSWQGPLTERVPLGRTPFTADEVMEILQEMRAKWTGPGYHPLRKNCGHFSFEFARRLQVKEAPVWLNSLAGVGDKLVRSLGEFMRPLSTPLSAPSLAGVARSASLRSLEFSTDLLEPSDEDISTDKLGDDPRVERQWAWAVERMKLHAKEGGSL
uniref:PPPDE domain-containing protein n=1 Tax=Alexandrium catenella TaxID=2925 RepID=A0A7S1RJG4_ALECA|mmetsp:Transcript_59380/g.159007  ORF Transcript_59380/g.159007 Transcript_59380/m.159007 type:complete len:221 (+) Transcript_59380:89-751(+)